MQPEILVLEGLSLGERVRIQRVLKGWRQIDVAKLAGVAPSYVSLLERDRPTYPKARQAILAALDLHDPYAGEAASGY